VPAAPESWAERHNNRIAAEFDVTRSIIIACADESGRHGR
jgi:hypothetical protein